MKQVFLFGISVSFLWTGTSAQTVYPTYETVSDTFCERYQWPSDKYVRLVKMPDGWHVTEIENDGDYLKTTKDQLFWKRGNNNWLSISYPPNMDNNTGCEQLSERKSYLYDVSPYYGYTGWYNDVIDEYGTTANLTDTLLYALMKAYYEKTSALISNQYGYAGSTDRLSQKFPPDVLSESELAEYKKWAAKDIETCERLKKQNPAFETFIGNIHQQLGNEYMSHWLNLYIWQNETAAHSFLVPDLYDPFTLDLAHNFLISCPPNAILFVNGDIDTYPLLYQQRQNGLRKDVTIVNLGMLSWPPYTLMLSRKYKLFKKSVSDEKIKDNRYYYVVLSEGKPMPASGLNKALKEKEISKEVVGSLPTDRFTIKSKLENIELHFAQSYLTLDGVMVLDIVAQNFAGRPICFSQTSVPDACFNPYLYNQGLVYVLYPKRHQSDLMGSIVLDGKKEMQLLLSDFHLGPYPGMPFGGSAGYISNYRKGYGTLAKSLAEEGDTLGAGLLLERVDRIFPPEETEITMAAYFVAEAYCLLGKKSKTLEYLDVLEKKLSSSAEFEQVLKELRDKAEKLP